MKLEYGTKINYLVLIEPIQIHDGKRNRSHWKVKCVCGKVFNTRTDALKNGTRDSCGCKHPQTGPIKHGLRHHRIYKIYMGMKQRCYNKNNHKYPQYGGRGIKICNEWSMKNGYQDDLSIDRIDNNKGYNPENCRWESKLTQSRNRRSSRIVEIKGEKKTFSEWCLLYEINRNTAVDRLRNGWDEVEAITTPVGGTK